MSACRKVRCRSGYNVMRQAVKTMLHGEGTGTRRLQKAAEGGTEQRQRYPQRRQKASQKASFHAPRVASRPAPRPRNHAYRPRPPTAGGSRHLPSSATAKERGAAQEACRSSSRMVRAPPQEGVSGIPPPGKRACSLLTYSAGDAHMERHT